MEALNVQLSPFFQWLLKTSLQGSLLICLILLVKTVLRGRLPIRWHYYLWLLLLVRLALPWAPQSRLSMFNLIPQYPSPERAEAALTTESKVNAEPHTIANYETTMDAAERTVVEQQTVQPKTATPEPKLISTSAPVVPEAAPQDRSDSPLPVSTGVVRILPLAWLLGAMALGGYVAVRNFSLWRTIKRERPITDSEILELLEDCKMQMNVQTIVGVIVTDMVKSPALFGFIRPRLLLPQGLIEALDFEELRYVFLHELAHLKRRDIYLGWLVSLLQVMHWFNPLIWFALRHMRTDQEMACDGLVLSTMNRDESPKYGKTIVNLFERFSQVSYVPSLAGILEEPSQLERRIKMIAKFKNNSYKWSPLAAILFVILACVSLPDAKQMKASETTQGVSAQHISLQRVWSPLYSHLLGELSPDGKYISYVDWGTGDLAVHEIANGKNRRITGKGSWDESNDCADASIWSPDSKQIAYCWDREEDDGLVDLRVVGLDGSEPRILYSTNEQTRWIEPCAWFPDGKRILAHLTGKDGTDQIVQFSVKDGSFRILKTVGKDCLARVKLSPDGQYIAYEFTQGADSLNLDISLISTDGSHEISLVEHPAVDLVLGWALDGKNILFASDRTGTLGMWLLAIADGKPQDSPVLIKPDIGQLEPLGFNRSGSFYYCISREGNDDIYVAGLDPETGKIQAPPKKAILRYEGSNVTASYSPDGKYLAYIYRAPTLTYTRSDRVLCIHSLETNKNQDFTFDFTLGADNLRWSPDGRSLLVAGIDNKNDSRGLYQVDAQTGDARLIIPQMREGGVSFHSFDWSRDGKSIFYVHLYEYCQIFVRDLKSGKEKEIYRSADCVYCPYRIDVSPDGKWLALSSQMQKRGIRSIKVLPVTGGEGRELCRFDEEGGWFTWSVYGKYILFSRQIRKDMKELCRIPSEGGEIEKLGLEMPKIRGLNIDPDGRNIVFSSLGSTPKTNEVWVMENFLPAAPVAKPEPIPTLQQVWAGPNVDPHVAASPDGQYLSYVDWKTGDLCIREIATGEMRPLTSKGNLETARLFALYSVISPDNRLIAYSWSNEHGTFSLCLVGIDGSEDRTLYASEDHNVFPVCWSSDSKQVVAKRYNNENLEIISVSVEQDSIKVLKKCDKPPLWDNFCYSSNDRFIVYDFPSEDHPTNYDIGLFDTKDNSETSLIEHPANDILLGCFPNREEILFLSDRAGSRDIWAVKFKDGQVQGSPRPVSRDIGQIYPHGLTRDGSFCFSRYTRRFTTNIVPFDAQTGEIHEQSNKPLLGSNSYPAWSPDGESMAYVTEKGDNRRLHIRSLSTGEERELVSDIEVRNPRWSSDGRFVLVPGFDQNVINRETYRGGIYKIDVRNGQATQLLGFSPDRQVGWARSTAEWSLDGKAIFYLAPNGIVRRELESGQEKQLYQSANLTRALDVSPDGKTLVFCEETPDERAFRIIVLPVSGGEPRELCKFEEPKGEIQVPRSVVWTTDGNYVLFAKDETKGSAIWRIAFQGGEPQMIMESSSDVHSLGIHPNGKEIAYCTYLQEGAIWVMENFLPKAVASAQK